MATYVVMFEAFIYVIYNALYKGKFILFNDASRGHLFSYPRLLNVKGMVIVTYFFRGNLLLPYRLLFPISNMGSFISTFQQTGQHIPVFDGPVVDDWLEWKIAQTTNAYVAQD